MWWRAYCSKLTRYIILPALPHLFTTSMQTVAFPPVDIQHCMDIAGINDYDCRYNPIKTLKTSFLGTMNMLGLAKRTRARFLLTSTSEVSTIALQVLMQH